tara:strand:- start:152 stop:376 length:225 start_codon:yes stop_codon:yes gene_type:complete
LYDYIVLKYIIDMSNSNNEKAELYNRFLAEYHRLDNEIGQIKMNKFDLDSNELKMVSELEKKKEYIMGRVNQLS